MTDIELYINQITTGIEVLKKMDKKDPRRSNVKQGVRRQIQYYTLLQPYIYSKAAKEFCDNISVDIIKLPKIKQSLLVGGEKGKPNILGDHTTPISELIEIMIQHPISDCQYLLENYSPVCWITREENQRLNKMKFAVKRPNGWETCYQLCEIDYILG
jgi:hypothetical protein